PSGGCVLKLIELSGKGCNVATAAFGRLCVETQAILAKHSCLEQPPSGGCVLKLANSRLHLLTNPQPPSGGCVLKQVGRSR
ncbi:hypothetical protein, partial [Neisseria sp. HMSC058F07]|uniref:hypothetical protein n=1 Tax=Neisseria sp. HMSC058F07 TaxID=1715175 RepID=UPI001AEFADB2